MKISAEQVKTFMETVGDVNYIHDSGIIPGMLIASMATKGQNDGAILCEYSIRFYEPIYVDQDVETEVQVIKKREKYKHEVINFKVGGKTCASATIKSIKGD